MLSPSARKSRKVRAANKQARADAGAVFHAAVALDSPAWNKFKKDHMKELVTRFSAPR